MRAHWTHVQTTSGPSTPHLQSNPAFTGHEPCPAVGSCPRVTLYSPRKLDPTPSIPRSREMRPCMRSSQEGHSGSTAECVNHTSHRTGVPRRMGATVRWPGCSPGQQGLSACVSVQVPSSTWRASVVRMYHAASAALRSQASRASCFWRPWGLHRAPDRAVKPADCRRLDGAGRYRLGLGPGLGQEPRDGVPPWPASLGPTPHPIRNQICQAAGYAGGASPGQGPAPRRHT